VVEFDHFRMNVGLTSFVLSPGKWVEKGRKREEGKGTGKQCFLNWIKKEEMSKNTIPLNRQTSKNKHLLIIKGEDIWNGSS